MSVRVATLTFTVHSGTSTQTVTGVQDADGSFVGEVFILDSAWAIKNTLTSGATFIGGYTDNRGVDTGSVRSALSAADTYTSFNFKGCTTGVSTGSHSIILQWATNFGSANFERQAKIGAIRSGEFDISYTQNLVDGDEILVTVIAGLDATFTNYTNGTYTTPSEPQGLLNLSVPAPASSGSTSGASGGNNVAWGFATKDGDYGVSSVYVVNQGENFSCQHTDGWAVDLDGSGNQSSPRATVSAWGSTSFTIANGGITAQPLAFSGADVRCAGGSITQPLTPSAQTFNAGIFPKGVLFLGTGHVAQSTVANTTGQLARGWASGTTAPSQHGLWAGEATVGNVGPEKGARYLSDSTVLRFGTPNAASTTFTSVAAVTAIATNGDITLNWTAVDGTAREILWFAIGEEIPAPPTPSFHTTTFVRRRLRRSPILWSENQGLQTQVRVNLIAVDMQPGVSTHVDTPDAQVMVRASKDGGRTWTSERFVSVGAIGAYTQRLNTWRWGQGRQWVVEVSTSDPVTYNLVNLYIDAEPGTS